MTTVSEPVGDDPVAPVTYTSYEEFGRQFFAVAVTALRQTNLRTVAAEDQNTILRLLAERLAEFLAEGPSHDIDGATGRERHDDAHGLARRIGLGLRGRRRERVAHDDRAVELLEAAADLGQAEVADDELDDGVRGVDLVRPGDGDGGGPGGGPGDYYDDDDDDFVPLKLPDRSNGRVRGVMDGGTSRALLAGLGHGGLGAPLTLRRGSDRVARRR